MRYDLDTVMRGQLPSCQVEGGGRMDGTGFFGMAAGAIAPGGAKCRA